MKNQKGSLGGVVLIIVAVLILGGAGYYFFLQNKQASSSSLVVSGKDKKSGGFDDSDMKFVTTKIAAEANSAAAFNAVESGAIAKADLDFLNKYFNTFSSKNLPPITESNKILAKYSSLLSVFDANVAKQYECSIMTGEACSLQSVRNIANLAALRTTTLIQQKKSREAQASAWNIVRLGQSTTALTGDVLTLLIGWSVQKLGYNIVDTIKPTGNFTEKGRQELISKLRQEHKNVLKASYTNIASQIDYITSPSNKTLRPLDQSEEEIVAVFRKEAATRSDAWNPLETKKYYYDSFKIELSNIDLACNAVPAASILDLKFDPKDTVAENYVGKTLYTTAYASLGGMNAKRCEIEALINTL
jgi:hypothetical protein